MCYYQPSILSPDSDNLTMSLGHHAVLTAAYYHLVPPPHHFEHYCTHVLDISKLFCSVVLLVEHYYTAWLLFSHLLAVVYLLRCMIDAVPHGVFIRLCD